MQKSYMQNMIIRKLKPEDLEQYNELLRYAFQVTEKTLLDYGWENDDIRQSKFPVLKRANVLGWFDGDKLAAQFAVYPMKMNIHGTPYNIGFITSVSTYPEYTGMKLMSELMKRSLTEMRDSGQSISLLYPFSIPLYRHKGWEIISDKMSFSIKDNQLPKNIFAPGYVRRVPFDSPDLIKLHYSFAVKTHGCVFRNDLAWEEYWRWDVDDTTIAIYYNLNGEPLGYMVYLLKDEIMHIKEMIYLNLEAWKGLWEYISAHESMIYEIKGNNYSSEPIAFWLEDSEIKETVHPYIMGRIVDVGKFLKNYNFINIKQDESISFVVKDNLLKWNNKTFTIKFSKTENPKLVDYISNNKVELSINTLTTMLLSYKSPSYLYNFERIKCNAEVINLLDSIISNVKAYISDYI